MSSTIDVPRKAEKQNKKQDQIKMQFALSDEEMSYLQDLDCKVDIGKAIIADLD